MSKTSKHTAIYMPSSEEDKIITAAALSDIDALPLTQKQLRAMIPLRSLPGRPPSEKRKLLVSVRYSPEVIACFKSTGAGWQSQMNTVLRKDVIRQSRRA